MKDDRKSVFLKTKKLTKSVVRIVDVSLVQNATMCVHNVRAR